MRCPKCNRESESNFCPYCGTAMTGDKKDKKAPSWPLPVFGGIFIVIVIALSVFGTGTKPSILSAHNPTDEAYSTVVNYIKAYNRGDRVAVAASFVDIEVGNEMAEKSCSSGAITFPTNTRILSCANADKAWVALSDIYIQMIINGVKQPPGFIFQSYDLERCGDRFKIKNMTEQDMSIFEKQFEISRRGFKHYKEYPDANQLSH